MKFKMLVEDCKGQWWEAYEKNIDNAAEWCESIIKGFNDSLRQGETPRKLLKVEVLGDKNSEELHNWIKRLDGMSVSFRGSMVDLMYCTKCDITGKRYGLSSVIRVDSKYRRKVFRKCNTAKAINRR